MTNSEIKAKIIAELEKAEAIWKKVGPRFVLEHSARFSHLEGVKVPSKIPGYPFIEDGKPKVQDFIALVYDIRGSTSHLLQAMNQTTSLVTQLQRVLYETTAVNTAGTLIVQEYKGAITEFLGDGFLALFKIDNRDSQVVYDAYHAASKCIDLTQSVINDLLRQRYNLPGLNVGVGLAFSPAIVTLVGLEDNYHAKALGECVYRASKLSKGVNEIYIDKALKLIWPTSNGGPIQFAPIPRFTFDAYRLTKKT